MNILKNIESTLLIVVLLELQIFSLEIKGQSRTTTPKKNMYHNIAIDNVRSNVVFLSTIEFFKADKKFQSIVSALPNNLNRNNASKYLKELKYLSDEFNVPEAIIKKYSYPFNSSSEIKNISHTATHAIADIYMSEGKYKKAITYFKKALFEKKYKTLSGTTYNKDYLRITYDLSEAYFKSNQKNDAYAQLLNLMMNSQFSEKEINKRFEAYTKTEDKVQLYIDITAALTSMKEDDVFSYSYMFRNKKYNVYSFLPKQGSAAVRVIDNSFVKSLPENLDIEIAAFEPDKNEYFFHDNELMNLYAGLLFLKEKPAFKSNTIFINHVNSFIKKIEHKKFKECYPELYYIFYNTFMLESSLKGSSTKEKQLLVNVRHLAGHFCADFLMSQKKYYDAIPFLFMMETTALYQYKSENPLHVEIDINKLRLDLANIYVSTKNYEYGSMYLLAVLVESEKYKNRAAKELDKVYTEAGKDRIKNLLTAILEGVEVVTDKEIVFTYNTLNYKFPNRKLLRAKQLKTILKESSFYKKVFN